jgi:ribosomal protein L7/L12
MTSPSSQQTVINVPSHSDQPSDLPQAAISALWRGQVVEAIKLVREHQQTGLKEAKDQVEAYLRSQPVLKRKMEQAQAEAREGVLRWLTFLLAGGAALAYFLM